MEQEHKKVTKLMEILINNNEDELKEFLLLNGKNPKPICPIRFIKKEEDNLCQN